MYFSSTFCLLLTYVLLFCVYRMAFISEFTNEIYDQSTAAFHEEQDSTRVFLGILVTLLPKVSSVLDSVSTLN